MGRIRGADGKFVQKYVVEETIPKLDGWKTKVLEACDAEEKGGIVREMLTDSYIADFLGINSHTFSEMRAGKHPYEEWYTPLLEIDRIRERVCARYLDKGTAWIFTAKQKRWGGWQDVQKSESSNTSKIEITLNGSDGKPLKVK